ncbi:MAG: zinc ABC transporter substrate-binding protein [Clostridia bacterium]|nr:zinc ABC transporter substrate-binding protein [Clostridia bacterium]
MSIKRIIAVFTTILLLLALASCAAPMAEVKGLHIICTVFPQYDWVRNILGEKAEENTLTLLMDNGADLHNYQATAEDLLAIGECDLFIYVGGESDEWATEALANHPNEKRKTIRLLDAGALEVPHIEEAEHDHDHDHEEALDEHIWLSLQRAEIICEKIALTLGELDPKSKELYQSNAKAYCKSLSDLNKKYAAAAKSGRRNTLLVGDRFPFLYLAKDYGLEYFAAFSGCSTETRASFETLAFLREKLDELALPFVVVTETSDQSVAKSVIANSNDPDRQILVLDSLQSVTKKRIEDGETYLSIMEKNLKILEQALGA